MAIELLRGFKWNNPKAKESVILQLEFQEVFILLALNQDHGLEENSPIPEDIAISLQVKLAKALEGGHA